MSAMLVPTLLTATQRFRCSACGREDKTTQRADGFTGGDVAQPAFAVKLPDGWHVFDGRQLCSLHCALQALDEAWPDWRPEQRSEAGAGSEGGNDEAAPRAARS